MAYSKKFRDEVLDEYRKSMANVTVTCRKMKINPVTFYNWCRDFPDFGEEVQYIKETERQDFVEHALFDRISKGDTTAIIFACKTICKGRGYVERQEVVGKDGKDLFATLTEEELQEKLADLNRKLSQQ
jgi:hypothetical protein